MSTGISKSNERPRLTAWGLLKQAWHFLNEHEVTTRASAIAFSGMMAAIPLLLMTVIICVQLLPDMTPARSGNGIGALTVEQLEEALRAMFPAEAYLVIEDQIGHIQAQPKVALISISVAITLWCASSLFIAIIDALNHIYGVKETRAYWRLRLRAMGMVILQLVIVTAALLGIIFWPNAAAYIGLDQTSWWYTEGVRWGLAVGVVMFSFALCFHMGPDVRQRHRWVTPGSIVGTALFLAACYGLKAYMQGFAHYDKTYGSLGGVMALLFWFYVSSLVLLLAAEINRIVDYAVRFGTDGHEMPPLGECVHKHGCSNTCHHHTHETGTGDNCRVVEEQPQAADDKDDASSAADKAAADETTKPAGSSDTSVKGTSGLPNGLTLLIINSDRGPIVVKELRLGEDAPSQRIEPDPAPGTDHTTQLP